MKREDFTVVCFIRRSLSEYWTGEGWDNSIQRALLASSSTAAEILQKLLPSHPGAKVFHVIMNKAWDYHGQLGDFVYQLKDAQLYDTIEQTEAAIVKLVDDMQ
jgi:hypothetical protein